MTWQQIKSAVEKLGISENDEILEIKCEQGDGNQKLHQIKIGKFIILAGTYQMRQANKPWDAVCRGLLQD